MIKENKNLINLMNVCQLLGIEFNEMIIETTETTFYLSIKDTNIEDDTFIGGDIQEIIYNLRMQELSEMKQTIKWKLDELETTTEHWEFILETLNFKNDYSEHLNDTVDDLLGDPENYEIDRWDFKTLGVISCINKKINVLNDKNLKLINQFNN